MNQIKIGKFIAERRKERGFLQKDIPKSLIAYISEYMECGSLNSYDIENTGKLFFYFLAVCNFYEQYYDSLSNNRNIYLKQADMAAGLLKWFESHIDELNEELCELSMQVTYQKKMSNLYAGRCFS